ncbi:MAG TPA: ABC transporter ATP-binding protein [Streptosporangiaceae bacterium]|jgi:ATP-binding cassette subfamily B protein
MTPAGGDRLLLRIARHGGWWLALVGTASVAGAIAQVLLPAALGRALDSALLADETTHGTHGGTSQWLAYCCLLVAVIVVSAAAATLATGMASTTATAWLRRLLAGHVLGCGAGLLDGSGAAFSAGDVVSRFVGGTVDAASAPGSAVLALTAVISPAGSVVALGLIDPWLAVAFAAGFPALAMVVRRLVRDSASVNVSYQAALGAIAGRLLDALGGARTIAAAGTAPAERRRILASLPALNAAGTTSWQVLGRAAAQGAIIVPALQVIVLAVAGVELARHRITPGELLAASQYVVIAVGVGASIGQLTRLGRARAGASRVADLFAWPRRRYGDSQLATGATGELRFSNVTVRRGDRVVLDDLTMTVPGGAAVAVVGASGSGKSTLAALAGRMLDPDEGAVELDDCALPWLTRRALRTAVVYAFERPALFGDTVADAIRFGVVSPASEAIAAALHSSQAAGFVTRLPDGADTPLRHAPMSGGEMQRLGLARAFAHARDARLLILDDATSSLDTATEMLVGRMLTEQFDDRTRLIVAHRASTAARADLVAWLDEGTLIALAPHSELWDDQDYRALFMEAC